MTSTTDDRRGTHSLVDLDVTPHRSGGVRLERRFRALGLMEARVGWSLVCLLVALTGSQAWGASLSVPSANAVSVALILLGLAGVWRTWAAPYGLSTLEQGIVIAGLAVAIIYFAVQVWAGDPSYGTDAVAFDQYAATLALHGHNPYTTSMAPSLALFHVPAIFHTYRLDGTAVEALSYPAGSFLAYIPVLAAGVRAQAANIVDLGFWLVNGVLMWRLLPARVRWVAGLVMSAMIYLDFVVGGLTDALFVPFLTLAVYRWDRYGDPEVGWLLRWGGPVALGIAASIKQTPWFFLPFLLVGVAAEARARGARPVRLVAAYAGTVAAVFAAINADYIVANPVAWLRGAVLPLMDSTIPDGQGLVNLAIFHGIGGGRLSFYTYAAIAFAALSLVAFTARYLTLKRAWIPLIALMFFLPTRSFGSYLFMLIPAALVAASTVRPASQLPFPSVSVRGRWLVGGLGAAVLSLVAVAVFSPAPLSITVLRTQSTGQEQTLDQITVRVTNRTNRPITPHFTVNANDHATTFWYPYSPSAGEVPLTLAPHASTVIDLRAPNVASMPSLAAPMLVEAYTAHPSTVSVSARYMVSGWSTQITPDAVNHPVPVHQRTRLEVSLQDRYGVPVHRAGVTVTLGQIVYAQSNLIPAESSINGQPEGRTPVTAVTNADGVAVFTIRGIQPQAEPVYYEAWLTTASGAPYGYSNQLSVQYQR